jgi:hypothetical protein
MLTKAPAARRGFGKLGARTLADHHVQRCYTRLGLVAMGCRQQHHKPVKSSFYRLVLSLKPNFMSRLFGREM